MHVLDRVRQSRELLFVTALVALVLGWALLRLAPILTPFLVAALFAYLVHPLVEWLERRLHLPRIAVVLILYLVLIGLLILSGLLVAPSLVQQAPALATTVPRVVETLEQRLAPAPELRFGELATDTRALSDRLASAAQSLAERFSREAVLLVLVTVETLIESLVFFLVSFYGLSRSRTVVARLQALVPRRHRKTVSRIPGSVDAPFRASMRAQLVLFAIMATTTSIALTVVEIEHRLALAIATGLLELIPFIGPWTTGAIAVSVALTQGTAPLGWSSLQLAVIVALVYLVLRLLEDHFVISQLVGEFVRLHSVSVLFGVLAGASVAGILGLLLAVPVLAALKIVVLSVLEELRLPPPRQILVLRDRALLPALPDSIAIAPARREVVPPVPTCVAVRNHRSLCQPASRRAFDHDVEVLVVPPILLPVVWPQLTADVASRACRAVGARMPSASSLAASLNEWRASGLCWSPRQSH